MHPSAIIDLSQLEAFLSDPKKASNEECKRASQLFESVWQRAPLSWKNKCYPSKPQDRLKFDLWKEDIITVPEAVCTELEKWKADPLSFFDVTLSTDLKTTEDPFARLARLLYNTSGGDQTIKNIRTRIGRIALFRLKKSLVQHRLRSGTDADDEFRQRIQSECDIEPKVLTSWVNSGGKYDSLSVDLGGDGSMVCWPEDISTAKLERIPLEGSDRNEAIVRLCARGINDQTKNDIKLCYEVAREIQNKIKQNEQSCFSQYLSTISVSKGIIKTHVYFHAGQPASRKRKRKVADETSDAEGYQRNEDSDQSRSSRSTTCVTVCQDTNSVSPTLSTSPPTPRVPTYEYTKQVICEESVAAECTMDSNLELLNQDTIHTRPASLESFSNGVSFDPSADFMNLHCFDPASEYLFLSQEPHLRRAGADQQRDVT